MYTGSQNADEIEHTEHMVRMMLFLLVPVALRTPGTLHTLCSLFPLFSWLTLHSQTLYTHSLHPDQPEPVSSTAWQSPRLNHAVVVINRV